MQTDNTAKLWALIKDIKYTSYEYVAETSPRDFFYLAWRSRNQRAAL